MNNKRVPNRIKATLYPDETEVEHVANNFLKEYIKSVDGK